MTLVGIYGDQGFSGLRIDKRKEFQRLIADCEAGKIDLVMVKSISRFSRNTVDCIEYLKRLKKHGVTVLFEKEGINTMDELKDKLSIMSARLGELYDQADMTFADIVKSADDICRRIKVVSETVNELIGITGSVGSLSGTALNIDSLKIAQDKVKPYTLSVLRNNLADNDFDDILRGNIPSFNRLALRSSSLLNIVVKRSIS